ncbi:MAG: sugar ABC transporter substrate-binding protein [Devosia nanyangense]|uniref:Sugar ABC transporter substrate-binding protein n=1 Tax=Devosia nanyangense TaxID=1228055 RepID=A0A933L3N8_9HYPH|nr:sugar ABC transporter substrate-binding protein [Devosia nanyangense]
MTKTIRNRSFGVLLGAAASIVALAGMARADDIQVAYLSASSANTWLAASAVEMQKVAAANGIKITEFDAQFDPAKQTAQMQDVIASGKYKGIVFVALTGAGAIPDVQAALDAGMQVVGLNQVIGADLTTSDPQVKGMAASAMAAPYRSGERLGKLAIKACEGIDPCSVVYIFGIKGIPLDVAMRQGFDDTITAHANISVVAEGEGKYLGPDGGIAATQDILQLNKPFQVMVGADQSIQGAAIALKDAGMAPGSVKLIGLGGSAPALAGVADGSWYGDVFGAPRDEGRLAMQAMVDALNGKMDGGIDPLTSVPDEGLITKDNVSKFTAQWNG